MKRTIMAAACVAVLGAAAPARAGVYADELTKCLVKSTTEADKAKLVEWIFSAMAADPSLKSLSSVSPEQRAALTRGFVEIFQRLVFADCRKEAVEGLKYEGDGVMQPSFSALGEIAMQRLMNGPSFQDTTAQMVTFMDKDKWTALFKEAGVNTAKSPAARP
jgi:hypothetical protein